MRAYRNRVVKWGILLVYAAFLAYLSLRPHSGSAVDEAVNALGRGYLHVPAYALLAVLLSWLVRSGMRPRAGVAFVIAFAYGAVLELAQIAVPTRTFNTLGLGLDAAGAVAGCLIALGLSRFRWWKCLAGRS